MTTTVAWLCGTGFSDRVDGVSLEFARHLDPARFEFQAIPYPADFGTHTSYIESVHVGRRALAAAVRATPHRAIIGGYSQGAYIAGSLASDIGLGRYPDLDVLACALIADPARPRGAGMPGEAAAPGYGISGPRDPIVDLPTWYAAVYDDPITALPAGSPLRGLADLTEWFSLASPEAALAWGFDLVRRAKARRWQQWWSATNLIACTEAIDQARRYLPRPVGGGRHDAAYIELGLAARLAQCVNREVRP
ncbi:PE-PPE domain-containing protein [Nocardia wallacei]|uniref:PE-PPE domain-containing protein n=1 Tax=Nocardia wallacei TaxID=480035 RepID=UPI002453B1D0|nr:PE-PPE domain-containing protein [Nocardia wallacei]